MDEFPVKRIRISLKYTTPNPLFEKWLSEFIEEAEKKDSKSQYQLKKALGSLRKYPLPLHTGRDCIILEGFGKGICNLLDKKLEAHIRAQMKENQPAGTNIVQLSESFRASEPYQETKRREKKEILNKVTSELEKQGVIASPKVAPKPRKPRGGKKTATQTQTQFEPYTMRAGDYEIVLLVDTCETMGKSKAHLDTTIKELNHYKVNYEIRRLSVGDFLWIARDKLGRELVLPYILERKRKDDLASSIKDGRFYEQKYRLKLCGLKNIIYLIESIGGNDQGLGLPIQNLYQAATNTLVQNRFKLKFTENNAHTVMYLHVVTSLLNKMYQGKNLISCLKKNVPEFDGIDDTEALFEFKEFSKASTKSKDPTVGEIFIKQLLQLKGLSVDKALAIAEVYPTPRKLLLAYRRCPVQKDAENLIAKIQYGPIKRPIGNVISKTIYQLFTNNKPS